MTYLVQFGSSVVSDSLWSHGLQHARLSCPSPPPRACSNSCSLSRCCDLTISSSVVPSSSCLQSFPESGSFLRSWLFTSRGQSIEASASVPPVNIQGWFPLGLTGLICLQYKEISIVLSNTTVQKHQALMLGNIEGRREGEDRAALSLLYVSAPTSIHDCWKNHIFDYTDLCRQSEVSDF